MTELLVRLNPELLRGWRAECTPLRLAVAVFLSAGVALCIQLAWDWSVLGTAALIAFGVLSFVVTPIRVVGAITEEHNRHTWQRQRMSALSPTQLMLGKAFGGAALTDLVALCALVCWALGVYLPTEDLIAQARGMDPGFVQRMMEQKQAAFPLNAWLMVCTNLFARFIALALAIRNCDRSRAARGRSFVVAILLALLLSIPLTAMRGTFAPQVMAAMDSVPFWFGLLPMNHDSFWAVSGLVFVMLSWFWCWCTARETLSTGRFASEAVVVSLGVGLWWAGTAAAAGGVPQLIQLEGEYSAGMLATAALLLVLAAIAYLWGLAERVDRRRAGEFLAAPSFHAAPAWLLILLLMAAALAVRLVLGVFSRSDEYDFVQQNFWAVSLLGFMVRDMGILFLVLAGRIRRWPELVALVSWLFLGLFLPAALTGVNAVVGGFQLYTLFTPVALGAESGDLVLGAISAWVQAGLMVFWLFSRREAEGR